MFLIIQLDLAMLETKEGWIMKNYLKSITRMLLVFGFSVSGHSETDPKSKFGGEKYSYHCHTTDEKEKLFLFGGFVLDQGEYTTTGELSVVHIEMGGRTEYFQNVEILKGAWMEQRMNLYLRDKEGKFLSGLVVDDFFGPQKKNVLGGLYGQLGNREVRCDILNPPFVPDETSYISLSGSYKMLLKIGDRIFEDQLELNSPEGPIKMIGFLGKINGSVTVPGVFSSPLHGEASCSFWESFCEFNFNIIAHENGQDFSVYYQGQLAVDDYLNTINHQVPIILTGKAYLAENKLLGTFIATQEGVSIQR